VLSRQLLIPLNSSKDDNSFVIIFLFLKFEIFVLFLLPTVKKIVYILLERMLIFPSVLCSPRASPSGYKLHLRKNHAFLSLNIQRVTEISTLILTGNRTLHDEQFFYVPLFRNRQFFLHFPPHKLTSRSAAYVNLLSTATR
jgi:hypothetical protein